MMYRRSLALLRDPEAAHDAVHDVFLKLSREIGSFRGEAALTTWLYRVVTNHCLNVIRKEKTRARQLGGMEEEDATQPPGAGLDRRRILETLLRQFDERRVRIVVYWYYDELSQAEIAALVGMTERGVRKALQSFQERARGLLRHLEITLGEVA